MAYRNYSVANGLIVGQLGNGDFASITQALNVAITGDTIFIRPGTYFENVTIPAGINLAAFQGDQVNPNVTIWGKVTMTASGTSSISNICLQTNSDYAVVVSGSAATILNLNSCYINCTNNTGINFTSTSSSSEINLNNCQGDIGTTGISLWSLSGGGTLMIDYCSFTNSGNSDSANSNSSGNVQVKWSYFYNPLETSSTGGIPVLRNSTISSASTNTTSLTINGTGPSNSTYTTFSSGSSSSISIGLGATLNLYHALLLSSNINNISGSGTLYYTDVAFGNTSSSVINPSNQTGGITKGGVIQNPSAGFIGEEIRSFVNSGSAIALINSVSANVTSINLTSGIWDLNALVIFSGSPTGTNLTISISPTSATLDIAGDDRASSPSMPTVNAGNSLTIPGYRVMLTSAATYYLVALSAFTGGSVSAFGRISATRVG